MSDKRSEGNRGRSAKASAAKAPARVTVTADQLRENTNAVMKKALASEVVVMGRDGEPSMYIVRRTDPLES